MASKVLFIVILTMPFIASCGSEDHGKLSQGQNLLKKNSSSNPSKHTYQPTVSEDGTRTTYKLDDPRVRDLPECKSPKTNEEEAPPAEGTKVKEPKPSNGWWWDRDRQFLTQKKPEPIKQQPNPVPSAQDPAQEVDTSKMSAVEKKVYVVKTHAQSLHIFAGLDLAIKRSVLKSSHVTIDEHLDCKRSVYILNEELDKAYDSAKSALVDIALDEVVQSKYRDVSRLAGLELVSSLFQSGDPDGKEIAEKILSLFSSCDGYDDCLTNAGSLRVYVDTYPELILAPEFQDKIFHSIDELKHPFIMRLANYALNSTLVQARFYHETQMHSIENYGRIPVLDSDKLAQLATELSDMMLIQDGGIIGYENLSQLHFNYHKTQLLEDVQNQLDKLYSNRANIISENNAKRYERQQEIDAAVAAGKKPPEFESKILSYDDLVNQLNQAMADESVVKDAVAKRNLLFGLVLSNSRGGKKAKKLVNEMSIPDIQLADKAFNELNEGRDLEREIDLRMVFSKRANNLYGELQSIHYGIQGMILYLQRLAQKDIRPWLSMFSYAALSGPYNHSLDPNVAVSALTMFSKYEYRMPHRRDLIDVTRAYGRELEFTDNFYSKTAKKINENSDSRKLITDKHPYGNLLGKLSAAEQAFTQSVKEARGYASRMSAAGYLDQVDKNGKRVTLEQKEKWLSRNYSSYDSITAQIVPIIRSLENINLVRREFMAVEAPAERQKRFEKFRKKVPAFLSAYLRLHCFGYYVPHMVESEFYDVGNNIENYETYLSKKPVFQSTAPDIFGNSEFDLKKVCGTIQGRDPSGNVGNYVHDAVDKTEWSEKKRMYVMRVAELPLMLLGSTAAGYLSPVASRYTKRFFIRNWVGVRSLFGYGTKAVSIPARLARWGARTAAPAVASASAGIFGFAGAQALILVPAGEKPLPFNWNNSWEDNKVSMSAYGEELAMGAAVFLTLQVVHPIFQGLGARVAGIEGATIYRKATLHRRMMARVQSVHRLSLERKMTLAQEFTVGGSTILGDTAIFTALPIATRTAYALWTPDDHDAILDPEMLKEDVKGALTVAFVFRLAGDFGMAKNRMKHIDPGVLKGVPNYYEIYGVSRETSSGDIRDIIKKKMNDVHPDRIKNGSIRVENMEKADLEFKRHGVAKKYFSTEKSRAEYDTALNGPRDWIKDFGDLMRLKMSAPSSKDTKVLRLPAPDSFE